MLRRITQAHITTGYIRDDVGGKTFGSYFEANVHAPNIFAVFNSLAQGLLPEIAAPIVGIKDEEPTLGPYTYLESAISVFEPHIELLQNDGFLEFGVTFQDEGKVEEIFVKSSKYFQIWTSQPEIVVRVFEEHNIPLCESLEFIDEYPMVSISLDANGNAAWPGVLGAIKDAFDDLPEPVK